jgi:hypothetical protein
MVNPYSNQPDSRFWKTGVATGDPFWIEDLWNPKFTISPKCKIATAGSCFGQHISKSLQQNSYSFMDYEPAPTGLPPCDHGSFGYSMYSARYGNIYTVQHLLQLAKEAFGLIDISKHACWEKDGRYYDAFRSRLEPRGFNSKEELLIHRAYHIKRVRALFSDMQVFIFTLGLTEGWEDASGSTCYPLAPGVHAGSYDENKYKFVNYTFSNIHAQFCEFLQILKLNRHDNSLPRVILTVSPVPLTATARNHHVLKSTIYSKSVLRAFAGQASDDFANVDYFPSYEIITNPASRAIFYGSNLREVTRNGVSTAMDHFWRGLGIDRRSAKPSESTSREAPPDAAKINCDEAILELIKR